MFDISYPIRCYDLCPMYDPCPVCAVASYDEIAYPYGYKRFYRPHCVYRCPPPPTLPPTPTTTTPRPLHESNTFEGFVERMWAYKSIQKYLNKMKYNEPDTTKQQELKKKALALSLKVSNHHRIRYNIVITQILQFLSVSLRHRIDFLDCDSGKYCSAIPCLCGIKR